MKKYSLWIIFLICIAVMSHAHAETLNDASIHALYDQIDAARNDPEATANIIRERAAPSFTLTSNTTYYLHDSSKTTTETMNKAQVLLNATHPHDAEIKTFVHKIVSITYSEDKKNAYITDMIIATLMVPAPAKDQHGPYTYAQSVKGNETLALIDGRIMALTNDRQIVVTLVDR